MSNPEAVNEGVLKDILEELDRERSKRAEIEAKVRKLEEEKSILEDSQRVQDERTRTAESLQVSYHSFRAMETELEGYQQLVDAITSGKRAISFAAQDEEQALRNKKDVTTLPLHIVRILEVLPWDPRVQQHIFAEEKIIEWEIHRDGDWQGRLAQFPAMFRTLRLVTADESADHQDQNVNLLSILANVERQTLGKHRNLDRVLTDSNITVLYVTDAGYPLPVGPGTWQWAGGWRVQKSIVDDTLIGDSSNKHLVDENGWSYAMKPQDFGKDNHTWDNSGSTDDDSRPTNPIRTFRRRFWTRRRVLVDYPFASESTRQYLKLFAEKESVSFAADKINEQLIDTKTNLTETERLLAEARSEVVKESSDTGMLETKVKELDESEMGNDSNRSKLSTSTETTKSTLDLSSKLTQWVQATRKTSEDMTISDESLEEGSIHEYSVGSSHGSSITGDYTPDKFDWKRFSRGTINKWKSQAGGVRAAGPHFNIQGNALFRKHSNIVDPTDVDDDL